MAERHNFSMWVYNPISEFTPDELEAWKECGMTTPMSPRINFGVDPVERVIEFLDRAEGLGMRLIINSVDFTFHSLLEIGEEEYTRRLAEAYSKLKGHPALFGFYVGDEPGSREQLDAVIQCFRIVKRVAPEVYSYANLIGYMADMSEEALGGTLTDWFKRVREASDMAVLSQDMYGQMINDVGVTTALSEIARVVEAAEAAGVTLWANVLCSAHYAYRAPNAHQVLWQVTVPAAIGYKGTIWFRFYDRTIGHEYYASPIDEYGYKTETYYSILRAQRRFSDHYGRILPTLRRKSTFLRGKEREYLPRFETGCHELIDVKCYEDAVISFFEDEAGREYMAIVNMYFDMHATIRISFDSEKCSVKEILLNGEMEQEIRSARPTDEYGGYDFYAGQMRLFRIDRK